MQENPIHRLGAALLCGLLLTLTPSALHAAEPASPASGAPTEEWTWPVEGRRIMLEPFRAPEQSWSAGHRGVDIATAVETPVRAPAAGEVAFRGVVVDRPLITIAHAGGLVTTLEPVRSTLEPGDRVAAGEVIGVVATGGHSPVGALHIGVRWHGAYINPMMLFGGIPRAVLLPCCEPLP